VIFAAMASDDNDHEWDLKESDRGNLPDDEEAFSKKCEEWHDRDWMKWLSEHLTFPFTVTREEDDDDAYFQPGAAKAPFRLGHTFEVVGLDEEDVDKGILVKAREKGRIREVPLCDLKVKPKTDKNYWPVREYVVWDANNY
jgi:hypothetical protein